LTSIDSCVCARARACVRVRARVLRACARVWSQWRVRVRQRERFVALKLALSHARANQTEFVCSRTRAAEANILRSDRRAVSLFMIQYVFAHACT
jgi:hypothetical protein